MGYLHLQWPYLNHFRKKQFGSTKNSFSYLFFTMVGLTECFFEYFE